MIILVNYERKEIFNYSYLSIIFAKAITIRIVQKSEKTWYLVKAISD